MEVLIHTVEKGCVLIALTVVLTGTRFAARLFAPRPALRDRAFAALFFFLLTAVEEMIARQHTPMDARIIAVCVAGLLAGSTVGGAVGIAASLLAFVWQGVPPAGCGLAMLGGGVAGGLIHERMPQKALRPVVGFGVGVGATLLRHGLASIFHGFGTAAQPLPLAMELLTAFVNGSGVALILTVVAQLRVREEQTKATAMAEVRALQARMNPHFLFNALNTVSALSVISPEAVAPAIARLGHFLRAGLDQPDRARVPFCEELAVVRAYLDIEGLRLGARLRVEETIAPEVQGFLIPPFLIQPLVENAVCHGIAPTPHGGMVHVWAVVEGANLHIIVRDTGVGFAASFLTDPAPGHALELLSRRLRSLYENGSARLWVESTPGHGTSAHVTIPAEAIGGEANRVS